jgi:hypothetical protein
MLHPAASASGCLPPFIVLLDAINDDDDHRDQDLATTIPAETPIGEALTRQCLSIIDLKFREIRVK